MADSFEHLGQVLQLLDGLVPDPPLQPDHAREVSALDQRVDGLAGGPQGLGDFGHGEERREGRRFASRRSCVRRLSMGSRITARMPDSSEFAVITARVPREMEAQLHRCLKRLNESQPGMHAKLSTIVRMALARGLESLEQEFSGKGRNEATLKTRL